MKISNSLYCRCCSITLEAVRDQWRCTLGVVQASNDEMMMTMILLVRQQLSSHDDDSDEMMTKMRERERETDR